MPGTVTQKTIDAIAAERGVDPAELDIVLHDYIDTGALERLERHGRGTWVLSFELAEFEVTVRSDGRVTVDSTAKKHEV